MTIIVEAPLSRLGPCWSSSVALPRVRVLPFSSCFLGIKGPAGPSLERSDGQRLAFAAGGAVSESARVVPGWLGKVFLERGLLMNGHRDFTSQLPIFKVPRATHYGMGAGRMHAGLPPPPSAD